MWATLVKNMSPKTFKKAQSGHTAMNVKDSLKSGESRRINWPL